MPARDVLTDAVPAATSAAPARPPGRAVRVLALQRAIGNHAVGRLLQRETEAEALLKLPTYKERLERLKGIAEGARTGYARGLRVHFSENPGDFTGLDANSQHAIALFMLKFLEEREARIFYEHFDAMLAESKGEAVPALLKRGRESEEKRQADLGDVLTFATEFGYAVSEKIYKHELFGNDAITLYPIERERIEGQKKKKTEEVHRPILDLERFNGQWCGRCYLALFKKAPPASGYKDITADPRGNVTLTNVRLMNLGNPFKALLWVEDYLTSTEHTKSGETPEPVIRSWLIPLSDVRWMLQGEEARPLDRDRASGQFGQFGSSGYVYSEKLHPVAGSLVTFVVNPQDLKIVEPGQTKLPMSLLQHFLTGSGGDPRQMATSGIAAQHGRQGHQAAFSGEHGEALGAYYTSLEETGFTPATADEAPHRRRSELSGIEKVKLEDYPYMQEELKRHPPPKT